MADDILGVAGKVCLVTGASSGLGAHFAALLAGRGALVAGASCAPPVGEDASVRHYDCDIRDGAAVEAVFEAVERDLGPVDVLVNAAGIAHFERAEQFDDEALADVFSTNVAGTMRVTREAATRMLAAKRSGSIIQVTSVLARTGMAGVCAYAGTKAALEQMMRAQAIEWARSGVRINALAPGWFATAMTKPFLDKGAGGFLKGRIPMRRLGRPDDLDGALLLLASDASRYMTGTVLTVDGGFSAGA
ncbi:SDR family oxidoreductase [Oricola sp.]|uniref:SDR family NAD(P)-dependent oxidoreductase n=1 Tax=Oricola sp. TaxID=1979950 RepID=UPI0025CCB8D6|nr:SDR family oxidoreductase [Oricola sp.]MCI5074734.1 SDR family oxidoreductase [Oricola sp.]